jgi:hypothetical protein
MDNNTNVDLVSYERQASLDDSLDSRLWNKAHVIIGCGGVGYWLGIHLAMMGADRFVLVDGDKIDATNLNRIPVPQTWIGTNKAVALRKTIRTLRPATRVVVLSTHYSDEKLGLFTKILSELSEVEYIWDCTDNANTQNNLYAKFGSQYTYTKLGYEAMKIGMYKDSHSWTAQGYTTGYRTSNANAMTSSIVSALGIFYTGLGRRQYEVDSRKDLNIDLAKLTEGKLK